MNRKDKTIKQLQAECKKREIGFMTNWTKIALTKRLEDEDKKDKELLEVKETLKKIEEKRDKELLEAKEKLQVVQNKIKAMPNEKSMQIDINEKIKLDKEKRLRYLKRRFHQLHQEQNRLFERTNAIAQERVELKKEITTIEEIIKSLI
jgi:hypothetical protein